MEDMYSKEILENIRELETLRASQNPKSLENAIKGSLDNATVELNKYGFPTIVYEGD